MNWRGLIDRLALSWAMAAMLLTVTVGLGGIHSWHDEQRIAQLGVLLLFGLSALLAPPSTLQGQGWVGYPEAKTRLLLSAAFILGAVSALLAPMPRWAFIEWAHLLLLIVFALQLSYLRYGREKVFDRVFLYAILFTVAAYTAKVAVALLSAITMNQPFFALWLIDGFSNPRFFGQWQSLTLPILALPLLDSRHRKPIRILSFVLLAVWWTLSLLSGTRGTWLAMACSILLAGIFFGRIGRRWMGWQLLGLAVGGFIYWIIFLNPNIQAITVNRLPQITSLSNRDILWTLSLDYIRSRPWLGIGPMHFAYYPNPVAAHPHNSILQLASEWGLPATFLLLAALCRAGLIHVSGVRHAVIARDPDAFLRLCLLAAICAGAVQSLVDGVIVMPYTQSMLAALSGWLFAINASRSSSSPKRHISEQEKWGYRLVIFIAIVILIWAVSFEIFNLRAFEAAWFNKHLGNWHPRFWQQGFIGS